MSAAAMPIVVRAILRVSVVIAPPAQVVRVALRPHAIGRGGTRGNNERASRSS